MQVSNVKYYSELTMDEYLSLPGVSYSSIKGFEGPPPAGMTLGTHVHQYLMEPEKYKWEDVDQVKKIAAALRQYVGIALEVMQHEVAFTADFHYNGLVMQYKGKADLLRVGRLVVDFKILSGSLQPAIVRFGYDKQVSGYCLANEAPTGLILAFNRKAKVVESAIIKPSEEWWNYQIVSRCQLPA